MLGLLYQALPDALCEVVTLEDQASMHVMNDIARKRHLNLTEESPVDKVIADHVPSQLISRQGTGRHQFRVGKQVLPTPIAKFVKRKTAKAFKECQKSLQAQRLNVITNDSPDGDLTRKSSKSSVEKEMYSLLMWSSRRCKSKQWTS